MLFLLKIWTRKNPSGERLGAQKRRHLNHKVLCLLYFFNYPQIYFQNDDANKRLGYLGLGENEGPALNDWGVHFQILVGLFQ